MIQRFWVVLIVFSLLVMVFPAQAQQSFSGCHGRVPGHVPALNVRMWPWGPITGQLWAYEGFDIWDSQSDALGNTWYRISYANWEGDPAIYWIAGWLIELEVCPVVPNG